MKKYLLYLGIIIIVFLVVVVGISVRQKTTSKQSQSQTEVAEITGVVKGVSLSPISYTGSDYTNFFTKAKEAGQLLSWAGPWKQLEQERSAPHQIITLAKQKGLLPVVITGFEKDELSSSELATSFAAATAAFAKQYQLPYIGIGNEIDQFYQSNTQQFDQVVAVIEKAAQEINKASPSTKVMTIFQLERVKGLNGGLFGGKNDLSNNRWDLLKRFPSVDLIGFTTYPCLIHKSPAEIPEEYYSEISNHTSLPAFFTEIGWFRTTPVTGWESNEQEQADFITRFKELTARVEVDGVIWPFLYDQSIQAPFQTVGLLPNTGEETISWRIWKEVSFLP